MAGDPVDIRIVAVSSRMQAERRRAGWVGFREPGARPCSKLLSSPRDMPDGFDKGRSFALIEWVRFYFPGPDPPAREPPRSG